MNLLPFIPNQIYNRRHDIHGVFGGNWQGGICPTSKYPYIFIFTGKSGNQHGYQDHWVNPDVFSYTGEGQSGDMQFTRGNLALRDHISNGKRVFLFESHSKGYVKFICEVEVFDVDYYETNDTIGIKRIGIKFFFKKIGATITAYPEINFQNIVLADPQVKMDHNLPGITERRGLITSRVGQGAYRKSIIYRWEARCAVTDFNNLDVLIASHIVPWADSNNQERLDVDNGILLSPTYDALFDRHLITFQNNGKIVLSNKIDYEAFQKIGITGKEHIKKLSTYNYSYLDRHRDRFEKLINSY